MIPFVFFGTSRFSVILLDRLHVLGITPSLIVTAPDRPVGRKQLITPPPIKVWADEHHIPTIQPESLKEASIDLAHLKTLKQYKLFIVASYGKIIPRYILDIPEHGALNIHPSLLPKYRGASPIQYQIKQNEQHIGTSIMLMDEEMDHGPLLVQNEVAEARSGDLPLPYDTTEDILARESADLLASVIEPWLQGTLTPTPQDDSAATYTHIITKADGEISLTNNPLTTYLTYLAFYTWPKVFFFHEKDGVKQRVIITDASYENNTFVIKRVIPEGKTERPYDSFIQ